MSQSLYLNSDHFISVYFSRSGGYADNLTGAGSTTGHGEAFMKKRISKNGATYFKQVDTHIRVARFLTHDMKPNLT